jgi:hypothetical protein
MMATGDAAHLLRLVTVALDGFEETPLPASVRRALRIAKLQGDGDETVRLSLELDFDGHRRLAETYPTVLESFMEDRDIGEIGLEVGLDEGVRYLVASIDELCKAAADPPMELSTRTKVRRANLAQVHTHIADGVRARTFQYLVGCETQLRLATAAEDIFTEHRLATERHLADVAPDVLDQLNAAIDRAGAEGGEARSHALTSCRRVLVAVADYVHPPSPDPYVDGSGIERPVGAGQYRNRILAAVEVSTAGRTYRAALASSVEYLAQRLDRLDELTQKGVHETVSEAEMRHSVIQTYLLAGEVLFACAAGNRTSA